MRKMVNQLFRRFYAWRYQRMQEVLQNPFSVQQVQWQNLILKAKDTEWGRRHAFRQIEKPADFRHALPLSDYEDLKPYILRMMHGEPHVLWPGRIKWFSKSSGTTSARSKFIPVSPENLRRCHIRGTWDTMTLFYHQRPDARQFDGKTMLMGGSLSRFEPYPSTIVGDVSAIMIDHMPWVARPFFIPDRETALLPEWEQKLELLAQTGAREKDIVMIGGVPTWTVVLFRRILEITGKNHMLEVWPNFQLYTHGGVSFTPYRQQFREFFPSDTVDFQEVYNASEGFFAVQDELQGEGMLLLLNNGVFYEFLPMTEWEKPNPQTVSLAEVETGKNYAIVISTNGGLWRYLPGDTVMFTSLRPFRIKVTGRTKQYINAFGEEVMVENTDQALAQTCQMMQAMVKEYTVAPVYFQSGQRGGHEWLIEFEKAPGDMEAFARVLDKNLQQLNSDYEAKRYKDMALGPLKLRALPQGSFLNWLKAKGKLGGQHKVPRLANHRAYIEDILGFIGEPV